VYAAPAYLAARGTPQSVADLAAHDCLSFVLPSTGRPVPWLFLQDGQEIEHAVNNGPRVRGDVLGTVRWAMAGGGLVQTYRFVAHEAVQRGELVEVLAARSGRSRPFSLLYPQSRHLSARVRALVGFLVEAVGQSPR
jgi:DNA-binding transcriptional LysR family regulator